MKPASPAAHAALRSIAAGARADGARELLRQALDAARDAHDVAGEFLLLERLADCERDRDEPHAAFGLWLEALERADAAGAGAEELASVEASLAMCLVRLGLPERAVAHATRAYDHAQLLPSGPKQVRALNALALTQTRLAHYQQAQFTYRQAIRLARRLPEARLELFRACLNRGVCCAQQAQALRSSARAEHDRLQRRVLRTDAVAARVSPTSKEVSYCRHNDLDALIALERIDEASALLADLQRENARAAADEPNRRTWAAMQSVFCGSILVKRGRFAEGADALVDGIGRLEAAGCTEELPRFLDELTEAYESDGRFEEALHACRRAGRLRQREARESSEARLRALEVMQGLDAARRSVEIERQRAHLIDQQRRDLLGQAARLSAAAHTDALTGLSNRRALDRAATTLAGLREGAVGVAVLDLDHFKQINDLYSHAVGDKVLVNVARILRSVCRPQDLIVRLGGEEIAVVMEGVADGVVARMSERMRRAVQGFDWGELRTGLAVTTSIGAVCMAAPFDLDAALAQADGLLYQAKRAGRNRVCCAPMSCD